MTPHEYTDWTNQILRYVGGLLISPPESTSFEIGRTFALLADADRPRYVEMLLRENRPGTREYEIGWDLRALLIGWPEAGVA
ncbi:hypothetical protein ACWDSF_06040 [Nocardia beijingensis]